MKKHTLLTHSGIGVFTLLLIGCSQLPQQEFDAAQAALTAAEEAEANLYVADLFQAAQDSFLAAQTEMEAQKAASFISRDYDRATGLLAYVTQTSTEARELVDGRKEELSLEAEALIGQAETALTTAQELLTRAPRGKEGNIALVSIQEDTQRVDTTLKEALAAQAAGEYAKAHDLAQEALDRANALVEEMNQAIAKTRTPRS